MAWLQLALGTQPHLEQTPPWSTLSRLPGELGRRDLAIVPGQAGDVGQMSGATHIVTSSLSATGQRLNLTLRVWKLGPTRVVGAPIMLTGDPQAVLTELPGAAARIARLLGEKNPVEVTVGHIQPADMAAAGDFRWTEPDSAGQRRLAGLSTRFPLAALLYLPVAASLNEHIFADTFRSLATSLPHNPVVLAEAAHITPAALPSSAALDTKTAFRSAQMAEARLGLARAHTDPIAELRAAEELVSYAPRSPDAWIELGTVLGEEAEHQRAAQSVDTAGSPDDRIPASLYRGQLAAAERASRLDPRNEDAWLRVSRSAASNGQAAVAENAYRKAAEIGKNDLDVHSWGIELYRQKWLGNPDKLLQAARAMVSYRPRTLYESRLRAIDLDGAGFRRIAFSLMQDVIKACHRRIRRSASDLDAHFTLAQCLSWSGKPAEATPEMKAAIKLEPQRADSHYQLASLLDQRQDPDCLDEYRMAVTLSPHTPRWHFDYAWALVHTAQESRALPEFADAIRLNPYDLDVRAGFAGVLNDLGQTAAATRQYQDIVTFSPGFEPACRDLAMIFVRQGHYSKALPLARRAVELQPWDRGARAVLRAAEERGKSGRPPGDPPNGAASRQISI